MNFTHDELTFHQIEGLFHTRGKAWGPAMMETVSASELQSSCKEYLCTVLLFAGLAGKISLYYLVLMKFTFSLQVLIDQLCPRPHLDPALTKPVFISSLSVFEGLDFQP